MTISKIAIAAVFGFIGLIIIIGNWGGMICWHLSKDKSKSFSPIPFLGGLFFALCLCNTPFKNFFWVAFIIDYGFWTGLFGLPYLLSQIFKDLFNIK